mmetsp:Transcript_60853/g.156857  ORF Transcript_60853/g.156857 Transcript_60853/m.156857 type:complete len:298 (-) Transcript_60853:154-1047(-)
MATMRFVACAAASFALVAVAALSAADCDESCQAEDELINDMRTELLQVDVNWRDKVLAQSAPGGYQKAFLNLLHTRYERTLAAIASEASATDGPVDCEQYPMFCNPRVNCAGKPLTTAERQSLSKTLSTATGHPNPRSWCLIYPLHAMSLQKCILEGNMTAYAQECYIAQEKLHLVEADAVYCFAADLCNNTEVTSNTTSAEAEAICDRNFGHSNWTSIGWKDFEDMLGRATQLLSNYKQANLTDYELWAIARRESSISAQVGCAMGNYRCDVFYCKQNFCNNDHWRTKYGNLSWTP